MTLGPGEVTRLSRSPEEEISIRDDENLLIIAAAAGFDGRSVQMEPLEWADGHAAREQGQPDLLPAWRTAAKVPVGAFKRGQQGAAALLWSGSGPLTVSLALHEPATSVDIQLLSPDGTRLGYANVTAGRPASLSLDLGPVLAARGYRGLLRADLKVFRGAARGSVKTPQTGAAAFVPAALDKLGGGSAYYNGNRHWATGTPTAMYYTISGAPANTCGELNTFRNGSWVISSGWACTNGSGAVTKGPWYTNTFSADQTDNPTYMRWPDGSSTNTDWHVLDAQCPTATRTSPSGSPPTTYYGNASDNVWGNCFGSWSYVYSTFVDTTNNANLYWTPAAGAYSQGAVGSAVYGVLSGRPSCGVSWDTAFPPVEAHVSGHSYLWTTCVYDGGCAGCTNLTFTR